MNRWQQVLRVGIGVMLVGSGTALAGDVTIPNTFTAGTRAVAAEVNANFDALAAEVNDNNARIADNARNKQNRVSGTCAAGSSIRAIAADGSVTCETDSGVENITAGTGLTGGGSGATVDLGIAAGGVGSREIRDGSITGADISPVAGIQPGQLMGDAGIEYNNVWWANNNVPTRIVSLGNITVSAPRAGTLLLIMTGNSSLEANGIGLTVGIGVNATAFSVDRFVAHGGGQMPFAMTWAVPIPRSGNYTYYALAQKTDPSGSGLVARVYSTNLVALFIPKRY